MIKRGAMFGLDARIALAIFGALSVISGAALFNAIQDSRAVSFYTHVKEVIKAQEQYLLDTGQHVPQVDGFRLFFGNLIENFGNIKGWNGPYFSTSKVIGSGLYFQTDLFGLSVSTYSFYYTDDEWIAPTPVECTGTEDNCYAWTMFHATSTNNAFNTYKEIFEYLDNKYDGGDGGNLGNIRRVESSATDSHVYYKALPYKPR